MTNEQAREIFNTAIQASNDRDTVARLELCREYFTNPKFRKALEDYTWKQNN